MDMSRSSLIASAALHVVLIGLGLVSLSSPREMASAASESIAVDFVPVEDKAQSVAGDKRAPLDEKPAPMPTDRPDTVADAQEIGNNTVDSKAPPVPEARPKQVEIADAAKKQPTPTDNPRPEEMVSQDKPTPVPATEVAPVPTPRQEVTPDPVKTADVRPAPRPEPKVDEIQKAIAEEAARAREEAAKQAAADKAERQAAEKEAVELAAKQAAEEKSQAEAAAKAKAQKEAAAKAAKEKAVAEAKAKSEKEAADKKAAEAVAAKAKERKDAEKATREAANKPRSNDEGSLDDDISKLLNKEKSGGGAKRSTQTAAAGTRKTTGGKLSQNEEGALRDQLVQCWNPPAGIDSGSGLRATIRVRVNPDKSIDGRPQIESSSGNRNFDESAIRAVNRCNSQGLKLPDGKEDVWADLVINFDPQDMLY